ncbi:MAG: pitrilysin family protein [Lentimicrobiaceae bacterium]|nr:pitrilysin family protein [Lentimicrobiaceae bacterium]
MKKQIYISILGLIIMTLSYQNIFSQNTSLDRSVMPTPSTAKKIELAEPKTFTLDNGLQVFVIENHKIPQITYSLILDYNSPIEGDKAGLSTIYGDMLRTGTKSRTKDQIDEELDMIGSRLSTSQSSIYASCLTKHNDKLLDIMTDIIINPNFIQPELDKLKVQHKSYLQTQKDEPASILRLVSNKVVYGENYPYGENTTEASIDNINVEDVDAYHKTYCRPNISYLAVVGDVVFDEIRPIIEKHFAGWTSAKVPENNYDIPKAPATTQVVMVNRNNAVQSNIGVCYPVELKPNSPDAIAADITNTILGGGTFRLFNNLREKHGWTYGAYSSLRARKTIGLFNATTQVRNMVTDSAVNEIVYEMNRIKTELVPDDELNLVKNYLMGSFGRSLENPRTVANMAVNTIRYDLPKDYYSTYLQRIEEIDANDVMKAANKYIKPENAYIVVVGSADENAEKLSRFSKSPIKYYNSEGEPIDTYKVTLEPVAEGITVQTVFDNYIDKIGGAKKIKKVKTFVRKAEVTVQGMTMNVDTYIKTPEMFFMQMSLQGMVASKMIYNNGKGVNIIPMQGDTKIPVEQDKIDGYRLSSFIFLEADYKKTDYSFNLLGVETLKDNSKAYKIEVRNNEKVIETLYYDVATGLKTMESTTDGDVFYSDYKEVDGIMFPHTISQKVQGMDLNISTKEIIINQKINNSLFEIE